jgi:proprotein convertase subtilisin/kexin type 5
MGYSMNSLDPNNKFCEAICGDGILMNDYERCDDGNNLNGDGCSSSCNI